MNPGPASPAVLAALGATRLARLLRARPDLANPAPRDLAELARRANRPASLLAALHRLDDRALRVVVCLAARADPALLEKVTDGQLTKVLDQLTELVIVAGDPPRLSTAVLSALGPNPGGLARPSANPIPVDRLTELLADLSRAECEVLGRMVWGPASGRLRDAERVIGPGPARGPVERLLTRGLLRPTSCDTVDLPREAALLLRAERRFRLRPALPDPPPVNAPPLGLAAARRMARELLTAPPAGGPALLAEAHGEDRWVELAYATDDGLTHQVVARVLTIGQGTAWLVRRHGRRFDVPLSRVISVRLGAPVVIDDLGDQSVPAATNDPSGRANPVCPADLGRQLGGLPTPD